MCQISLVESMNSLPPPSSLLILTLQPSHSFNPPPPPSAAPLSLFGPSLCHSRSGSLFLLAVFDTCERIAVTASFITGRTPPVVLDSVHTSCVKASFQLAHSDFTSTQVQLQICSVHRT